MANYTAAIANKGWYYTPHIVKSIDGKPNPDPRFKVKHKTMVQNPKYYDLVMQGNGSCNAKRNRQQVWKSNDFTQLAKTGTAQVPQGKDNSIFALIAPADKPKIVVVAVMEHAGFGATLGRPAACTVIAEKYITGTLKREHLYKKMINASFMAEYKRQCVVTNEHGTKTKRRFGSIRLKKIQDSLKQLNKRD